MKLTNKQNLPEPMFRAIERDNYNPGECDITVTQLISPARQSALTRHHYKELEEDAADRIWILMGQLGHLLLERAGGKDEITELRLVHEIHGWKVSGQFDLWSKRNSILDYKFTSAWAVKDGVKPEWEAQLNLYRWLAMQEGKEVGELQIVAILRDWSKLEAARNGDYPRHNVKVMNVTVWSDGVLHHYIADRIAQHKQARASLKAEGNGIVPLPECTEEERWAKPTRYAAMKTGGKRAIKVCDTHAEALAVPGMGRVDVRLGAWTRCEHYCSVKEFCSQWKARTTLGEDEPA